MFLYSPSYAIESFDLFSNAVCSHNTRGEDDDDDDDDDMNSILFHVCYRHHKQLM